MIILGFKEFNNKYNIENKAMSDIPIENIVQDISLILIKVLMQEQTPKTIVNEEYSFNSNLHPTDGTNWVLITKKRQIEFNILIAL